MTSVLPGYQATHHPSHSGLLCRPSRPATRADIDAIVVPTIRHFSVLRQALELGLKLHRPVVALCSRSAEPRGAIDLARRLGAHLIAVNVRGRPALPELQTSAMLTQQKLSDLSLKRNISLALARMAGWRRILFLDDDITDIDSQDVGAASALLDSYPIVALENVGFPDNSVVCHGVRRVQRALGLVQESFVGGGAMVVAPDRVDSFFPDIYNEDWFYMLGVLDQPPGPKQIAATGAVKQIPYDPFIDPFRARLEELGDCLGEGIFALLDDERPLATAMEHDYWKVFLADRGSLIQRVLAAAVEMRLETVERMKIAESLQAAQGRHRSITPEYCVKYFQAWNADRETWQKYLAELPTGIRPEMALRHLKLRPEVAQPR